jgi:hypothetical protein
MMMKTNDLLADYLHRVEGDAPLTFGPPKKSEADRAQLAQERAALIGRLEAKALTHGKLLAAVVVGYFILLAGGLVLVFVFASTPKTLTVVLGGNFLSLSGIVVGLRSLWREKVMLDMLVCVLPELEASEAVKLVQSVYFSRALGGRTTAGGTSKAAVRGRHTHATQAPGVDQN